MKNTVRYHHLWDCEILSKKIKRERVNSRFATLMEGGLQILPSGHGAVPALTHSVRRWPKCTFVVVTTGWKIGSASQFWEYKNYIRNQNRIKSLYEKDCKNYFGKTCHLLSVRSLPDVFTGPEHDVVQDENLITQTKIHTICHSNLLYPNLIKSAFASHVMRVPCLWNWSLRGVFAFSGFAIYTCGMKQKEKSHAHSSPIIPFGSLWFSLVEPWLSLGWLI